MDFGLVVHVHVFNVHRGSIAFRDHLKTDHDISQSSLWYAFDATREKLVASSFGLSIEKNFQ